MTVTPKMKKKPSIGTRAWRLLRLAVLWARNNNGGAAHHLRLLRATLRRHGIGTGTRGDRRLRYGEREFSIEETPAFRFRTPSARVLRLIPCIAPHVPDTPGMCCYGDDGRYFFSDALRRGDEDNDDDAASYYGYGGAGHVDDDGDEINGSESSCADEEQLLEQAMAEARRASTTATPRDGGEDAGVDVRAEEFIARFYAQIKLQRQISWLQYNEMMQRSVS